MTDKNVEKLVELGFKEVDIVRKSATQNIKATGIEWVELVFYNSINSCPNRRNPNFVHE